MDRKREALAALGCMDLTSLGDADTAADIEALCAKAEGPAGKVAAVCVWPRFAALAKAKAPEGVKVAAVANFPTGEGSLEEALADIAMIVGAGADEVDLVFPYKAFLAGKSVEAAAFVRACKAACGAAALKVILESGAYPDAESVRAAAAICLDAGAEFVKTSTGKIAVGATPEAAKAILGEIASRPGCEAGFKASGGVRSVDDAATYLGLVRGILGSDAAGPGRFRIGASGLLAAIEAELGVGGVPAPKKPSAGIAY